jgi:hypothetical protein
MLLAIDIFADLPHDTPDRGVPRLPLLIGKTPVSSTGLRVRRRTKQMVNCTFASCTNSFRRLRTYRSRLHAEDRRQLHP